MNAVILCDLKKYSIKFSTERILCSFLEINNEKILKKQVDILRNCGIINIYLVVGFKSEKIISYFQEKIFDDLNIKIITNYYWEYNESAFSLLLALEKMPKQEPFIVFEGNKIFNQEVIQEILNNPIPNLCLVRNKHNYSNGSLKVLVNGRTGRIQKIDKEVVCIDYQKRRWMRKPKIAGYSLAIYKFEITNKVREELKRTSPKNNFEYTVNELLGLNIIHPLRITEKMKIIKFINYLDFNKAQEMFKENNV